MKIIGAGWTPKYNLLEIRCSCKRIFDTRADRHNVKCPFCKKMTKVYNLREDYCRKNRGGINERVKSIHES